MPVDWWQHTVAVSEHQGYEGLAAVYRTAPGTATGQASGLVQNSKRGLDLTKGNGCLYRY